MFSIVSPFCLESEVVLYAPKSEVEEQALLSFAQLERLIEHVLRGLGAASELGGHLSHFEKA